MYKNDFANLKFPAAVVTFTLSVLALSYSCCFLDQAANATGSVQSPALNSSPNVTYLTSLPATVTRWVPPWTTAGPNPAYAYSGMVPTQAGLTYPYDEEVSSSPLPKSSLGFGRENVSFWSDSPEIAILYTPDELGALAVCVDGTEIGRIGQTINSGTSDGGSSNTITLASSASTINNFYSLNWVTITGGTGTGQTRQIILATNNALSYNGSSRTAIVSQPWTTLPDGSSKYIVTVSKMNAAQSNSEGGAGCVDVQWNGERRFRLYNVQVAGTWDGIYTVSNADSVYASMPSSNPLCFWVGDSFSEGIGTDQIPSSSLAAIACSQLGWTVWNLSIGGTGYLNRGSGSLTVSDRIIPPVNAWTFDLETGDGSFEIRQGDLTTNPIGVSGLTYSALQSACDSAFGTGYFRVAGGTSGTMSRWWLICESPSGRGSTAPMTLRLNDAATGLAVPVISRYTGDLAPNVPTVNGIVQPFYIVFANGHNDTTDVNSGYSVTLLNSVLSNLYSAIATEYPTAKVFVVGYMDISGMPDAAVVQCNQQIGSVVSSDLPLLNGIAPFVDPIDQQWVVGSGNILYPTGNGNEDTLTYTDGIHPNQTSGHPFFGLRIAQSIQSMLAR
jgi:hypothetical protein